MEVRELETDDERREAVPVLRQLWTDHDPETVLTWTAADDYHLFGGYADDDLVGVAGVLVAGLLHHERHAWLYDLVVDEPSRGEGYGRELVSYVEDWARKRDCASVALASPLDKDGTHAFYDALEYEKWGYVVEKRFDDGD